MPCMLHCRVTRIDAASDFFGEHNVPRRAITMGVATILKVGERDVTDPGSPCSRAAACWRWRDREHTKEQALAVAELDPSSP